MNLHAILSGPKNLENGQILGDDSVHSGICCLLENPLSLRNLRIEKYCVESQEYPDSELMSVIAETPDILH